MGSEIFLGEGDGEGGVCRKVELRVSLSPISTFITISMLFEPEVKCVNKSELDGDFFCNPTARICPAA